MYFLSLDFSVCSLSGNSHIMTFDKAMLQYQGLCKYFVVKSDQESPEQFSISAKNEKNNATGAIVLSYIEINHNETVVRFWRNASSNVIGVGITKVSIIYQSQPSSIKVMLMYSKITNIDITL